MVHARVYTGARTRQRIAQIALSKIKNQSYHSANPISLPSHAHQISSSSSLASAVLVVGTVAATGWDVLSSLSEPELFWHVTRTPSVLMRPTPRRRTLPLSPPVDAASPRPESTRKSCNVLSSVVLTFCRGSHAGCEKPRGARSKTCVCVGAVNSHEVR